MSKIKVSFLFGAGAECFSFNMPTGVEYQRNTLLCENFGKVYGKSLKNNFKETFFNKGYKYTRHHVNSGNIVYYSILENLIRRKYENKSIKEINQLIKDSRKKEVVNDLKGYLKSNTKFSNHFLTELLENREIDKIGFAGILDSLFYNIINPAKFSQIQFSKIINYYWNCYFYLVDKIIETFQKNNIDLSKLEEFIDKKTNKLCYEKLLNDIDNFTKKLYGLKSFIKENFKNSYYFNISNNLEELKEKISLSGIFTTNYFSFSEIINDDVVYLNGKLSLFEYPELLEVRDYLKEEADNKKIFFPFIFGQSYTKPIVCKSQITEFNKFNEKLESSDCLIILGYNINADDNHINSFLHNFIEIFKRKIIIVTEITKPVTLENIKYDYAEKLKISKDNENLIILDCKYPRKENDDDELSKELVNNIFSKIEDICK